MSLHSELVSYFNDFAATMPAARLATIQEAGRALETSGIVERALKEGDTAPDFALPAANGRTVSFAEVLRRGPAVVSFNRGGWCPFCSLELRAYQKAHPEIAAAGASLLAILPQTVEHSRAMAERMSLTYPVLSDKGCRLAEKFGVAFELPTAIREIYRESGAVLPDYNASADWRLPIPATYIVASDGRIVLADVDVHVEHRLEPLEAIEAVRQLAGARTSAA